jgi:diguanylate cyclase (GGDEF)-like protein/PAS domain S-box-containing protein
MTMTLEAVGTSLATLAEHRQAILDNVLEAIITADADGRIQSFNKAATQIFGYRADEVLGGNLALLMPEPEASQHAGHMARYAATRRARVIGVGRETRGRHRSGRVFPIHLSVSALERDGKLTYVGLIRDISAQKEAEHHIERLAYYDPLTGLANRRLLLDRVVQAQRRLTRQRGHAALIFADIDQFKAVNDTLGHAAGDALLRAAGRRLEEAVGPWGTVARLGGDEFALLIPGLHADPAIAHQEAEAWCQTLLELTRRHHGLFGREIRTSASLGAVLFADGRESAEALLAQADTAMYQAKSGSRDSYRFFDAEMARSAAQRATLLHDLRLALPRGELALAYQPQVDDAGKLLGAEALLRWRHPTRGLVSPADFIPLAEQSGFVIEIGRWVLAQACELLARWRHDPRLSQLTLAVNVSATEFHAPDFVESVARTVADTGADPRRLKLELTESVLSADLGDLAGKLHLLKRMGLGLSLDDFGTGYSAIAYLRELPLDQLKIDRSFIVEIESSERDRAIVQGIVALCGILGLSAIAEGVETEGQRQLLLAGGCLHFQGWLTGRPMSAEELGMMAGG